MKSIFNKKNETENFVYFDNAATSFFKPKQVQNDICKSINVLTANPGRSGHLLSQKVAEVVFQTRENVKDFLGAKQYELIFTKNCTEALNLAILGTLKSGDHVITTCYEHNSVLRPLQHVKNLGVEVSILSCDLCDFAQLFESEIKQNTKLIITTFVSNVTGEICDVKQVGKICKKHNLKYLIDGAQACGHIEINLQEIGADMFAFAGHKGLLSLTGVGGLLVKDLKEIAPIIFGGTGTESENLNQPVDTVEGYEAGTIPSMCIISLNSGVKFLKQNFFKILEKEQKIRDFLYNSLKKLEFLTIFSKKCGLNVISFNLKNIDSSTVANILNNNFNIYVRAGFHCAPLIHKKNKTDKVGAVRVSVDFNNSIEEVNYLICALKQINEKFNV